MKIFCQRSREDTSQSPNRGGHQPEQPPEKPEQSVQPRPDQGAQEDEIPGPAQKQTGQQVEAHPPLLQDGGAEEEDPQHPQPVLLF